MKIPRQEIYVGKNEQGYAVFNTRVEREINFDHLSWGIGFVDVSPPQRKITLYREGLKFSELEEQLREEMSKGEESVTYREIPPDVAKGYSRINPVTMIYLNLRF